ncbi:hypothetical protein [Rhodoferax sp.]|uniref:hypothetical protein n=1 Tax=Rhodoferax sp. TaxID=50421 RepID=UPI0027436611|nr:hypothetical protein [Rhodoferax sp.]
MKSTLLAVEPTPATTATPWLATVPVLASIYADAGVTPGGVRMDIFKADDRLNSRGEKIEGNGLAKYGAIVRRGRKVLIDVHRYGAWLAGRAPAQN